MKKEDEYTIFGINLKETPRTLRYYKDENGIVKVDMYRDKNEYVTGKVRIKKVIINF